MDLLGNGKVGFKSMSLVMGLVYTRLEPRQFFLLDFFVQLTLKKHISFTQYDFSKRSNFNKPLNASFVSIIK